MSRSAEFQLKAGTALGLLQCALPFQRTALHCAVSSPTSEGNLRSARRRGGEGGVDGSRREAESLAELGPTAGWQSGAHHTPTRVAKAEGGSNVPARCAASLLLQFQCSQRVRPGCPPAVSFRSHNSSALFNGSRKQWRSMGTAEPCNEIQSSGAAVR